MYLTVHCYELTFFCFAATQNMRRASSAFVQCSGAPHHGKTTTSNKQQKVASAMVRTRRSSRGKPPPLEDPFEGRKRHRVLATHAEGVPRLGRGTAEFFILLQLVFAASLLFPGRASTQNSLSISPNYLDPSMGSRVRTLEYQLDVAKGTIQKDQCRCFSQRIFVEENQKRRSQHRRASRNDANDAW